CLCVGAARYHMSLGLERSNLFEGEEAERTLGTAVMLEVPMGIAFEAELGHVRGWNGPLGPPTRRHVDLCDRRARRHPAASVAIPCAMARSYVRRGPAASLGHPSGGGSGLALDHALDRRLQHQLAAMIHHLVAIAHDAPIGLLGLALVGDDHAHA